MKSVFVIPADKVDGVIDLVRQNIDTVEIHFVEDEEARGVNRMKVIGNESAVNEVGSLLVIGAIDCHQV